MNARVGDRSSMTVEEMELLMVRTTGATRDDSMSSPSSEPGRFPLAFGTPPLMRGRVDRVGDMVILTLDGEFDLVARDTFAAAMVAIEKTHPHGIVVNVHGLTFMNSTGINQLFDAHQRAIGVHSFAVLNGTGPAHRTLELVELDKVLTMVDTASQLPGVHTLGRRGA
jgi:anti-anti-sigma factor